MVDFRRLIEIAEALKPHHKSAHFHCSFITKGKRIIAIGLNNEHKTHPRNLKYHYKNRFNQDISHVVGTHSELDAIRKCDRFDLSNYRLINIRINNNGQVAYSKPCPGCQNLLRYVKFREVWYSDGINFEQFRYA